MWIQTKSNADGSDSYLVNSRRLDFIYESISGYPSLRGEQTSADKRHTLYAPDAFEDLSESERHAKQAAQVNAAMAHIALCFQLVRPICDLRQDFFLKADSPTDRGERDALNIEP